MTRINLVDPSILTTRHLIAEFREIRHVVPSLRRSLKSKTWSITKIPPTFRLNRGHVSFFYDKILYLEKRYDQIIDEMICRKINLSTIPTFDVDVPSCFYNDWTPKTEDYNEVINRICLRLEQKPKLYNDKEVFLEGLKQYF